MDDDPSEPMLSKPGPTGKKTRLSTWFAIVFALGFGGALLGMTYVQWNIQCEQPMKLFMLFHGIAGAVAALFFLLCEVMYIESKDPYNDGALRGLTLKFFVLLVLYYLATGTFGATMYFRPGDCEDVAYTTYRWTWASTLLFLIMATMMFSDVFGKLGAPFFSKLGHIFGAVFQVIADVFNTLADVLDEDPDDPEDVPPSKSAATKFAVYVNHAGFLWFFLYILFEAWRERNNPCDKPLRTYLYVFSITGTTITYIHFLWEMFAGVKTRKKFAQQQFKFFLIFAAAFFVWGGFGFNWVHTSTTCEDVDTGAPQTYRISYLLSLVVAALVAMIALFILLGILDFLCSGKMRFVVVISTGNDDDDDDIQS